MKPTETSTTQNIRGLSNDDVERKHRDTPGAALGNNAAWHCPRCQDVWYRQFADEICQGCGEEPNPVLWDGRNTVTPVLRSTEAPMRDIVGTSESEYPAEMVLSCSHIVRLTPEMFSQYRRKEFDQIGCVMCWRISRAPKDEAKRLGGEVTVI
jgi:hypothetical protein